MLLLLACHPEPPGSGVYRSGANAVVRGERSGELRVWGSDGTHLRMTSPGPAGSSFVGQAGGLWIVDRDLPAPPRAAAVQAALVETIGFRLKPLLGAEGGSALDPARSAGVWVRSVVKVRQKMAPPVYVVSGARDDVGAGRLGAGPVQRQGEDCRAVVAILDHEAETVIASMSLDLATRLCLVPSLVPPVDRDGDGGQDLMVHGQDGARGFRSWVELKPGPTLELGPQDSWEAIPG